MEDHLKTYAIYPNCQREHRARLYAAHQKTLDLYWDEDGQFRWEPNPKAHGGFRAILWHCLSYLSGDERCIEWANRIILTNAHERPCHFAPGAAVDVLFHYRDRLWPEVIQKLERYLQLHIPYMSTEDLKIHGYNDNHPYKAMHAMIVGGEMLDEPYYVQRGLSRLREAVEMCQRNGFPCEYNSPNYTPVSLQPLASIVEMTRNEEARALALKLEHYYWRDLAEHFDARAGIPAGPMSRAMVHDYDGLFSNDLMLLLHLYPEPFQPSLVEELFKQGQDSRYIAPSMHRNLPFLQAHPVWFARPDYHLTPELEARLFDFKSRESVRGTAESGTGAIKWDADKRPEGAPSKHHFGPRRSLLTTHYGENFTLGTAQYSWLDNSQAHAFYATIAKQPASGEKLDPAHAALYFARHFLDENYPYGPGGEESTCFKDQGEVRTVQHENTALVFYNPQPIQRQIKRIRTGIFRPLRFSQPRQLFVGDDAVPHLNFIGDEMNAIAIDEGEVFVGILPLRLTNHGQSIKENLRIHTYGDHLSILISSFEAWGPTDFAYEDILTTNAGFAFEIHPAADFESFTHFRHWLNHIEISDDYYADMRTTTYHRPGLTLSSCYSPFQSAFRHATANGTPIE